MGWRENGARRGRYVPQAIQQSHSPYLGIVFVGTLNSRFVLFTSSEATSLFFLLSSVIGTEKKELKQI
jgi:hypothetical protein